MKHDLDFSYFFSIVKRAIQATKCDERKLDETHTDYLSRLGLSNGFDAVKHLRR